MSGPPSPANLARRLALTPLIIPSYNLSDEEQSASTIHYRPVAGTPAPARRTRPSQTRPSQEMVNAQPASLDRDMMEDIPRTPPPAYPRPALPPTYHFDRDEEAVEAKTTKAKTRCSARHPRLFCAFCGSVILGVVVLVSALCIHFGGGSGGSGAGNHVLRLKVE